VPNQQLIDFYKGEGGDAASRRIETVWAFGHEQLESVHDYIQWLFPVEKPSQYNSDAPLLDGETIAVFKDDASLQERLVRSLRLLLDFYGLQLVDGVIAKSSAYAERQSTWQDAAQGHINHNLLRLTRIIECLRLLGLGDIATALYNCLAQIQSEVPDRIPAKTAGFWKQAAGL